MSANPAPAGRPGRFRRALRAWHRIFGLSAALWLVLLALTGSAIAFYDELDRWLNPDLRTVSSDTRAAPDVEAALRSAQAALPGFEARFIDLPDSQGESLSMLGSAQLGRGEASAVQVFIDPGNARLLGWRDLEHLSLHPHHLVDTLYAVHTELLLHDAGVWLIGLLALLWMLDHFAGVALALPRVAGAWEALRIRGRGMNLRRIYDLHRAPSLWLVPITFTLALSGWCLTWYSETRTLAGLVSPVTERLHERFPDADDALAADAGLNQAIDIVRARVDGGIDSVLVIPRKAAWGVRSFDPRDVDDFGRLWTYVSMKDGAIRGQRHDIGSSAADTFFAWQYPLHSGRAFGLAGKAVVSIAGVGTTILCATGMWLWWRRRR